MSVKEQEPTQIKKSGRSLWLEEKWQDPAWRAERIRTMTGHLVSQDTREKIGKANRDRRRTPEYRRKMSLEKSGGVWVKAYPLLLRGGLVEEVAKITGLQKKQIENLKGHLRKRGGLKRPTKEEEKQAKRKSHLGKPSRSERIYTFHQEKTSLLVGKFLEAGLFTEDLSAWNALQSLYRENGRKLSEDFVDQLRLEVFLRARGSRELLISYRDFGDEVDPVWFNLSLRGEEDFIASNTALGLREDKKGYFSVVDGKKFRPIDIRDGSFVVLDGEELARREEFRSS